MSTLHLKRVMRLDSIKLDDTYWTEEGYLIDHPIVTSCGIFEYTNPDGSVRRELRLPENVFDEASLATYEGKPIIITHDAGKVDKNNVEQEQIGTILSKGFQDGNDVRAKIVIHDTDALRRCGLRELSLGYNLTTDETPGVWNGQPYDAIQKNIEINHLALVANARAGEQARLNIDGQEEKPTLKGGKIMSKKKRNDGGPLTPEELKEAVAAYKARKAQRAGAGMDTDDPATAAVADTENTPTAQDEETTAEAVKDEEGVDKVQMLKDRRDRRDQEGDPATPEEAMGVIAQQDEDIDTLLGVIEAMKAKQDFDEADEPNKDSDEENTDEDEENKDGSEDQSGSMNADSVDRIVRTRVALARIGDRLNLDGLDSMNIMDAKKAIIKKVKPSMRLDGKGKTYIDAAFDLAVEELNSRKDTDYQRRQMFNSDSKQAAPTGKTAAERAREKMIEKRNGGNI